MVYSDFGVGCGAGKWWSFPRVPLCIQRWVETVCMQAVTVMFCVIHNPGPERYVSAVSKRSGWWTLTSLVRNGLLERRPCPCEVKRSSAVKFGQRADSSSWKTLNHKIHFMQRAVAEKGQLLAEGLHLQKMCPRKS